jgi:hypothetical protein
MASTSQQVRTESHSERHPGAPDEEPINPLRDLVEDAPANDLGRGLEDPDETTENEFVDPEVARLQLAELANELRALRIGDPLKPTDFMLDGLLAMSGLPRNAGLKVVDCLNAKAKQWVGSDHIPFEELETVSMALTFEVLNMRKLIRNQDLEMAARDDVIDGLRERLELVEGSGKHGSRLIVTPEVFTGEDGSMMWTDHIANVFETSGRPREAWVGEASCYLRGKAMTQWQKLRSRRCRLAWVACCC